jgi:hypothetical protein
LPKESKKKRRFRGKKRVSQQRSTSERKEDVYQRRREMDKQTKN